MCAEFWLFCEDGMASYSTNEFKGGLKIMIDGDPCSIIENEFVKPGKGQAFNRVKIRNLKTGRVIERTYKSGESVEAADVVETELQYLYNDGEFWHFMDQETYEQVSADAAAVGESAKWLKDQDVCTVTLWNGSPIIVEVPNFVILTVTETDPGSEWSVNITGSPATVVSFETASANVTNTYYEECGECDGKITLLEFLYDGDTSVNITIYQKAPRGNIQVYNGTVEHGDTFTIEGAYAQGQGRHKIKTLWTEIYIYINGEEYARIHTSCSDPNVGPGMIIGDLEIIYGESRNGGPLCPLPPI